MKNLFLISTIMILANLLTACASNSNSVNNAATNGANNNVAASSPMPGSKDEVICKRVKAKGSNISKKVCKTRAEMDQERERAGEVMEKIRSISNPNTQ